MTVQWERLAREVVYQGRAVDIRRDSVLITTDGRTREVRYDVVHHPGATAVVPLFDDGTVALVHQFRYPVGGTIWEIPAGTLHGGEAPLTCAIRELEEETGHKAARWTPLASFFTTPGFCDERMHVYLAEELTDGERALDEDEHMEVVRMPIVEAVEWVESGRIRDAKSILGLLAARRQLERDGRWPPGGIGAGPA